MTSQKRLLSGLLLFFTLSLLLSCREENNASSAAIAPADTWFTIPLSGQPLRLQVMLSQPEMARGLMYREHLGEMEGMLFVYDRPQRMSFYMRNTKIPLDIGFFNQAGQLQEIQPLYPFDESSVRSKSDAIQFALEVNQGWFARHQLKPGASLSLPSLVTALKARGADPLRYGLPAE